MIDLSIILKGHEGETFWNPLLGDVKLHSVGAYGNKDIIVISHEGKLINTLKGFDSTNNMAIYPSCTQRIWIKWLQEQTPKVWDDIVTANPDILKNIDFLGANSHDPVSKSALALLKINILIEKGYGGNITNEEWESCDAKWVIKVFTSKFDYTSVCHDRSHVAFHNQEQAEEFLKHPENIELLNDYFMM